MPTSLQRLVAAMLAAAGVITAQELLPEEAASGIPYPSVGLSLGYASRYLGEGVVSNPDPVFQGDFNLFWGGFQTGVAVVYDLTDWLGYRHEVEEWNYYLGYAWTLPPAGPLGEITLSIGWTYFDIPRDRAADAQELSLSVTLDEVPLTPALAANWDYENDTWWFSLSAGHSLPLPSIDERLSWDVSAEMFSGNGRWVEGAYGVRRAGVTALCLTTGPVFAVSDSLTLRGFVTLAFTPDRSLRRPLRDQPENQGVTTLAGLALDFAL